MTAAVRLASRSCADWQAATCPFARNRAEVPDWLRARLYTEVQF